MHSQSPPLIHRDIKSGNILLTGFQASCLNDSHVKVADFGTVRADERNGGTTHTSGYEQTHGLTKMAVGTTPYMPTEYANLGHISAKTDAFAFGILVIELLTNLHPRSARELADSYTDLKARTNRLREIAKECKWVNTEGARTIVCEIAAQCTAGSATRKTPADVLAALEGVYNNGTFVPRGGTIGRALGF
jgi:serine/threonine protein kinase